MPKLIITCGVSGSGKSTYAKDLVKQGWAEVNRDDVRFKLFTDGVQDQSLYKFTNDRENKVTEFCEASFDAWVHLSKDIVVSNTNLNKKDHNYWKAKAEQAGYEFEIKFFDITLEEAFKRNDKRGPLAVPREVLIQQWKKYRQITNAKVYVPNKHKPKAILCDIDGTVALVNGRSHFEFDKVMTDKPRLEIISMVSSWAERDNLEIIFLSGRDDSCYTDTVRWIGTYMDIECPTLFMRKTDDNRNDRIVKEEIFFDKISDNYNVVAAVDDRPRVVRLWHDIGIPNVINVQTGYEEF